MKTLKKIVLAGGSGYLGTVLTRFYREIADEIIILSRHPKPVEGNLRHLSWDGRQTGPWVESLDGADLLVNLCGKNVNCRYTQANRREILRSRVEPTALLGRVMAGLQQPPRVWVQLASATIYRHAEDLSQDEDGGEMGEGFSVDVCRAWEKSFWEAPAPGVKKVLLRVSLVLGLEDGVFPRLRNLARLGLGGPQGPGSQYVSWVHETDLARSVEWARTKGRADGIYNVAAPDALTNRELMRLVRRYSGRRWGLPTPRWLLELGARLIGTETELVLKSRWVEPKNLLQEGFQFRYADAETALSGLCGSTPKPRKV